MDTNSISKPFVASLIENQEEMERAKRRLNLALRSGEIGLWEWDVINEEFSFEGAFENIFEITEKDASGLTILEQSIHPEDKGIVNEAISKVKSTNQSIDLEYRLQIEGKIKFLSISIEPLFSAKEELRFILGSIKDITTQKESEFEKIQEVLKAQENERDRLSKELHDNLCQILAASKLNLNAGITKLSKGDAEGSTARLNVVLEILNQAIEETRNLSHLLSPGHIQNKGLVFATKQLISYLQNDTIELTFNTNMADDQELPDIVELNLFRVIQEMVSNAIQHSKGTEASIDISLKQSRLTVIISDNGIGLNTNKGHGLGMFNIAKRLESIEATLETTSRSKGTKHEIVCAINMFDAL